MLTHITPEHLRSWGADAHLIEAFAGLQSLTPAEVLDLDLPAEDRLWVVLRPEVLCERSMRLIACDVATWVLRHYEAYRPDDDRPRRAIETARRFAVGEATQKELEFAAESARYAAYAARAGARGAAWSAAFSAERSAAEAAAWAARDAAWAARAGARTIEAARAAEVNQWFRTLDIVRGYLARESSGDGHA